MRQLTNAISTTRRVYDWLAGSRSPKILHVFNCACNLINERREVLSVVTAEVGKGPFNLVLENQFCFDEYLHKDSSVSASADQLHLGDLTIHTFGIQLWNPNLDWKTLHDNKVAIMQHVERSIWIQRRKPNLQTAALWHELSRSLASSIAAVDIASCIKTAKALAGLGQGLTPSGDDIMVGAMYAAQIMHPPDVAELIIESVMNTAAPLTTSLSAAYLKAAAGGEAGIRWHRLLDALVAGKTSAIQRSIAEILSIGATSGADALTGFTDTCMVYLETEKNHVVP